MKNSVSIYKPFGHWLTIGLLTVLILSFGIFADAIAAGKGLHSKSAVPELVVPTEHADSTQPA